MLEQLGAQVQDWLETGRPVAVARVVKLTGFSTWAGDPLVAISPDGFSEGSSDGERIGDILGQFGVEAMAPVVAQLTPQTFEVVDIDVHDDAAVQAGLACGGQASLLLQPAVEIPPALWRALADRAAVALITRIEGPTAGPASMVVLADGSWSGALVVGEADHLASEAVSLMAEGEHGTRRIEDGAGVVLIEAWVPEPRVVVLGDGDLLAAIEAQAGLLGWEARGATSLASASAALEWAGESAALAVLSHDGALDMPVIRQALENGVAYVGAMGSRRTQEARLSRLREAGVAEELLGRVHRPIGLDLGGRRPSEVALAIIAEVLAVRHGRDGRSLRQKDGPIHARTVGVS